MMMKKHATRTLNFALFEDGKKKSAMHGHDLNGPTDVVGHELILEGFTCRPG